MLTPRVRLSFACGGYDRMDALRTGEIQPQGVDLDFVTIDNSRELFDRCMGEKEFDAAEMSASEYIRNYTNGDRDFVAIPVFPNRAFRHSFIAVNSDLVNSPKDLAGKKVGVQVYTMTAAIWIRAILAQVGVDLSKITWVEGALERPGPHGRLTRNTTFRNVTVERNKDPARGLSQLLANGDIAATIGAALPANLEKMPNCRRLFPDYETVEKEYYRQTGVFPIMHLVLIKRSLVEQYPWVPGSLFDAMTKSKNIAVNKLKTMDAMKCMLPWFGNSIAEAEKVFGADLWPCGIEANRVTLEVFVNALYDQGMIDRRPSLEELFWPIDSTKRRTAQSHSAVACT